MATAIVTGFTVHAPLMHASLSPLIALRRAGTLKRIVYVTWDNREYDEYVAPAEALREVEVVRVPRPDVAASDYKAGFLFQNRNLSHALSLISDPDELVVKLRPDFIFDRTFLAEKIATFPKWGPSPDFSHYIPVDMPPTPFSARIWVPWATANMLFYMEDAAFIGSRRDLEALATPQSELLISEYASEETPLMAHTLRFIIPFLEGYSLFRAALAHFRLFAMGTEYRKAFLQAALSDPFFWHLLLAQAWILATSFHIDCGRQGQLRFVQSSTARECLERSVHEIPDNVLYADVESWRQMERPGTMMPLLMQLCGRLVDDGWLHALFSAPVESGFAPETLRHILNNIRLYETGLLSELESTFYEAAEKLYRDHIVCRVSSSTAVG